MNIQKGIIHQSAGSGVGRDHRTNLALFLKFLPLGTNQGLY